MMNKIFQLPKTLLFNFYYLPFEQAIKLPIRVKGKLKIGGLGRRGNVIVEDPDKKIIIGQKGSFALSANSITYWKVEPEAKIIFHGGAVISGGTQIIACGGV